MRTAIIVNHVYNESLLRFTETKLFFDAENQGIHFVDDCLIVKSIDEANTLAETLDNVVILQIGDFLTTKFREKHKDSVGIINAIDDPDTIKFDLHTHIGFSKKCHYPNSSKQLYIIENLLKTCLRNRKLVYLDNTEPMAPGSFNNVRHLYGLASGWKTVQLAEMIGFDSLESITVYDKNQVQLEHARWAHSYEVLPDQCPTYAQTFGEYKPHTVSKQTWKQWNEFDVNFKQINLFDLPQFPAQSLIWISNVFRYESNIFEFGWEICKNTHKQLCEKNKESIII